MHIIGCKDTKKKRVSQIADPIFILFKYFGMKRFRQSTTGEVPHITC